MSQAFYLIQLGYIFEICKMINEILRNDASFGLAVLTGYC